MSDLTPGSPEWARRVSPSKAAAILGISPWDSQRAMWHKMRGDVPWDEESEAMERGNLCEAAVLAWWRKHHGDPDAPYGEQVIHRLDEWAVATPDAVTQLDGDFTVIEAKTAANMDDWGDPGTDQVPAYYLAQAYTCMAIARACGTEVARVHMPVLGGRRLLFSNYVIEYDADICDDLLQRLRVWADTLAADTPPPLDDSLATFEAMRRVHPDIDMDAVAEITEAEAVELLSASLDLADAEARDRLARSTVLDHMGRARFAVCNGIKVARRQPSGKGIAFYPLTKNLPLLTELEQSA